MSNPKVGSGDAGRPPIPPREGAVTPKAVEPVLEMRAPASASRESYTEDTIEISPDYGTARKKCADLRLSGAELESYRVFIIPDSRGSAKEVVVYSEEEWATRKESDNAFPAWEAGKSVDEFAPVSV